MIKKEYTRDDVTVVWQPSLCIHSGICFHQLPAVFRPRERPWIVMDAAEKESIIATVKACPSGALSIKPTEQKPMSDSQTPSANKVTIFSNGPVRVVGACSVTLPDGTVVEKPNGVSFCRCGGSANKPFCDGSHRTNGYEG